MKLFEFITDYIDNCGDKTMIIKDTKFLKSIESHPQDLLLGLYMSFSEKGYNFKNMVITEYSDVSNCEEFIRRDDVTKEEKFIIALVVLRTLYPVTRQGVNYIIKCLIDV